MTFPGLFCTLVWHQAQSPKCRKLALYVLYMSQENLPTVHVTTPLYNDNSQHLARLIRLFAKTTTAYFMEYQSCRFLAYSSRQRNLNQHLAGKTTKCTVLQELLLSVDKKIFSLIQSSRVYVECDCMVAALNLLSTDVMCNEVFNIHNPLACYIKRRQHCFKRTYLLRCLTYVAVTWLQ